MIEYIGRVQNGVVVFEGPAPPLEGRRVRIQELTPAPVDESDRSFWEELSLEELAARQGVSPVAKLEDLQGGWPEDEIDDGFEIELRRWRSGGKDLDQ